MRWGTEKNDRCAKDIVTYLKSRKAWSDTWIYVNGKRYSNTSCIYEDRNKVFVENNINPNKYFEGDAGFLSMSFEGRVYCLMNGYEIDATFIKKMESIARSYRKRIRWVNHYTITLVD